MGNSNNNNKSNLIIAIGGALAVAGGLIYFSKYFLPATKPSAAPEIQSKEANKMAQSESELLEKLMQKANEQQKNFKHEEAIKLYEEALTKAEVIHGKISFYYATIKNMIATILLVDFKSLQKAMPVLEENKKLFEMLITDENYLIIEDKNKIGFLTCISILGNCYYLSNENEKAMKMYEEYSENAKKFKINLPELESEVNYLRGAIYFKLEKYPAAIENFNNSIRILEKLLGENNLHYMSYLRTLGEAYLKNKEYLRALGVFDKAIKISMKLGGAGQAEFVNECSQYVNHIHFELSKSR